MAYNPPVQFPEFDISSPGLKCFQPKLQLKNHIPSMQPLLPNAITKSELKTETEV